MASLKRCRAPSEVPQAESVPVVEGVGSSRSQPEIHAGTIPLEPQFAQALGAENGACACRRWELLVLNGREVCAFWVEVVGLETVWSAPLHNTKAESDETRCGLSVTY